uniref:Uncharacterized protein n=1 Tax=Nelumbo nucifera TaxID=4432 RepID=A0A822Y8G1_NELNU|nr:TPA_asm: hypothetical protein HUJ06_028954 [Nelumbo nucifera]
MKLDHKLTEIFILVKLDHMPLVELSMSYRSNRGMV